MRQRNVRLMVCFGLLLPVTWGAGCARTAASAGCSNPCGAATSGPASPSAPAAANNNPALKGNYAFSLRARFHDYSAATAASGTHGNTVFADAEPNGCDWRLAILDGCGDVECAGARRWRQRGACRQQRSGQRAVECDGSRRSYERHVYSEHIDCCRGNVCDNLGDV